MKAWKYIATGLVVVTLVLATGWILRNTLIERLSNPLLDEYGLKITDVSLDALATRDASISYLELRHSNGAIIAIDDMVLPIRRSASGTRRIGAAKVRIDVPAGGNDDLVDLAGVLNRLLELPLQLPQTQIDIGELSVPPYPLLHDLQWHTAGTKQHLTGTFGSMSLAADVSQRDDAYYLVRLSFLENVDGAGEQSLTVDLQRIDSGISLDGSGSLDLRLWSPVIALLGIDEIDVDSGLATLQFDGEIAYDANQIPFVNAGFTPTTPVLLTSAEPGSAIRSMTVKSASTTEISLALTDFTWTLRQSQASLSALDRYGNDIAVSLANFSCKPGPACSGDVRIDGDDVRLPFARIGRVEFAATQEFAIENENLRGRLRPDATVALSDISYTDVALKALQAKLSSEAEFEYGNSGWQITSQSADVDIGEYSITDDLTVSATVYFDNVAAGESNDRPFMKAGVFASGSNAKWMDRRIRLPGFRGTVSLDNTLVGAVLETDGLAVDADIEAQHDLEAENGRLSMRHAGLSFGAAPLSGRFTPRPRGWDVIAGTLDMDLDASWRDESAARNISATASIRAADLAGNWQDTVVTGLNTRIDASFDSARGFSVQPSTIAVALLEIGVPLENISARYVLHPDEMSVDIADLRMTAFGGIITADPFSFSTANDRNNMTLHIASIDLAEILSFEEFEAVEVSGRIGAELPVTIEGNNVTINGGKLTGDAPGGVIRYRSGAGGDQADASGIGFATRALSNFQFETLTSDVDYDANGDLKLQMRLTGRNPDLDSKRPVILNLGVENNVRQMLRSLQAARAVEDVLERRLGKQDSPIGRN